MKPTFENGTKPTKPDKPNNSTEDTSNIVTFNESDYVLTFADEFNESSFSAWTGHGSGGRWATSIRPTQDDSRTIASNNELQYYVDPDMTEFENPFVSTSETLGIYADRLDVTQSALADGMDYSSGDISTQQSFQFQHGYVEISAKVPGETGMWSALWLQTEVEGGVPKEIDILEVLGSDPTMAFQDSHGNNTHVSYTTNVDTSDGFHTYGLLWDADTITWLMDGEVVRTETNFVNEEMFLTINLAMGGWAQTPTLGTDFNEGLEIDYVRIYQPIEDVVVEDHLQLGENYTPADAYVATEGQGEVLGSRWADEIIGSSGDDIISSKAGDDNIYTELGNDIVYGGEGNDNVSGGEGADMLYGGNDNDTLIGDGGDDYLYGENGDDQLEGSAGSDTLFGGQGNDILIGGLEADDLFGNIGNDQLFGGDGADKLVGGAEADLIIGGQGDDHLWGGDFSADQAIDVFVFAAGDGADTIYDFENTLDILDLNYFGSDYVSIENATIDLGGYINIDLAQIGGNAGDSITL